jgi:aryl-alcohol dehydrogenase-like predicted oxidoreductase
MKKRRLGKSGIEVSPLCLGGNVFGWTLDPQKSFTVLDGFLAAGFEFIDTADVYAKWVPGNKGGESEAILGRWLKERGNRQQVIVATKVGMEMGDGEKGLSKAYILREAEASLKRLQSDYIDLYQSHQDDPDTPLEETMEAYAQLVKQGKVRAIGASNYKAERLSEALQVSREHGYPRYETLQPLYNLYDRQEYESKLEPVCLQHGLGVIPYFSLASGFLTGKYRSEADLAKSQRGPGVKKYLNERGFRILSALDQVGHKYHASPVRVALGWLVARRGITAAIASATNLDQLNDLAEGVKLELDEASIALLNEASR